ncbi:hypothetical protein SEA_LILPHARAOH_7 [Mycobacterium phage LilPharaoh]|uniref:Uncharacterized protein n=1 Tax=Mycobacterium phage Amelie TaxID=1913035 RepID=A0A1J0GR44_9CAUD|nr:hypothetical protein AVV01_gp07 [Mycobacterium phage Enkosi]YP_009952525.1 hypothetical protein I5G92_gp07 [Mycobacterium phage Amelie]ATN90460.1 hypothetical protein SEA_LILPHARAOH_7 [Mycobacterium phage LilPharaoh]AVP42584.1 hypothetical protein SEA_SGTBEANSPROUT_7 [Mycobacterium phage SgtBeansprout]AXC37113.1 hypothetical protein SEA_BIGLEBOPS_7 [Mycobacterium phage Biglebops]QGJ93292.1 hypothetical protein PBI_MDAVU_7 [Mycobacterium phage Mdavu]UQS94408.1 hypothetical protein SEA_NUTEL
MNRDELVAAYREGRAAAVGDENPYTGTGAPARMWRRGYRQMLAEWFGARSPALQTYLQAQAE